MSGQAQPISNGTALNSGQRRLYELIDSALLEFGSLEPRQQAILALAKELKIGKSQLKALVSKARENHPQINAVARVHKLIENAKSSGKTPDLSMFRRLQPSAKSAGKDDTWLGEQLGYMPQFLIDAKKDKDAEKGANKPLIIASLIMLLLVGLFVWWSTLGELMYRQYQQDQLDDQAWRESRSANTYPAYEQYLRSQPNGQYTAFAQARMTELDEAAWEEAVVANTRAAFQDYVAVYSIHEGEARAYLSGRLTSDVFRDCLGCPQLTVLPAGSFRMGSANGQSDELPVRQVTIEQPIAVGKFEVSFAEWDVCAMRGACSRDIYDSTFGRESRPVINIDWHDAQDYVNWLSQESGQTYRLLTEAEWEYAARAGASSEFWWGNSLVADRAVCVGCVSNWSNETTELVGQYSANAFGLHDTAGNVAEWVQDCRHGNYSGAPVTGEAWMDDGSGDCSMAVIRGGSWQSHPPEVRNAERSFAPLTYRDPSIGFRVARELN